MRKNFFYILLLALFAVFVWLVFYGFPDSPSPWFDEGVILGVAKSYVQGGVYDLNVGPGQYSGKPHLLITSNFPLLFFVILIFKLLGIGLWQAKIASIIFLLSFFCLFYFVGKKYYGRWLALIGLALVISFLPLYGNGKSVLGEVPGLVYFLGGLLMLDKKKWWQIFLAGLLFGLAASTKSLYMLFIPALTGGEIWLAIKNKETNWRRWFYLAVGGFLPLILWVWTILPVDLSWRSLAEFVAYYRNPYNLATGSVIFKNFLRFFTETTPLHFLMLFGVFAVSKIIRREFRQIEIVVILFVALDWIFYLKTVGWYRYFFPAHVLLFILFPAAFLTVAQKIIPFGWRSKIIFLFFAAILFAQTNQLFLNINQKLYYNPSPGVFAQFVNNNVPADKDILVVHNPAIAFLLEGKNVWQRLIINPYLTVGRDWFGEGRYPDYVVMDDGNQILLSEDNLTGKYRKVYQAGKAVLWQKI